MLEVSQMAALLASQNLASDRGIATVAVVDKGLGVYAIQAVTAGLEFVINVAGDLIREGAEEEADRLKFELEALGFVIGEVAGG